MKPNVRLVLGGAGLLLLVGWASVAAWGQELSHARIVRLSFTEGMVTVQRPDVEEWATAPTNTPIQEGFRVATADGSFAEIEFENSSTARIGQSSLLEFTQLALLPSGGKVNRMTLHQGYATFNVIPDGDDSYLVNAGDATFTPQGRTRFRVDFEEDAMLVKVFMGSVEIMSPEGTGTLGKNSVLEIRPGTAEPFQLAQGITKDAWDEWVEERENRMQLARNYGPPGLYSNNVRDLMYGSMDLLYYGTWYTLPGYGFGWSPRMGMGWSPFTSGRWCWYPGLGYTWISYEPWGWLPYHYGGWIYDPSIGWCWIPTGYAAWSPAVVSWYQGSGWVGWAPRSPTRGDSSRNCPRPEGCVVVVSDDTLQHGRPIQPGSFQWNRTDIARQIATVSVEPDQGALLPGSARGLIGSSRRGIGDDVSRATGQRESPAAARGGMSVTGGFVNRPAGSDSGIVYDRERGQYVNNPARAAAAPTTSTTSAGAASTDDGGVAGAISLGARPAPRGNYPSPVARGSSAASGPNRTAIPGASARSGDSDQGGGDFTGVYPGVWSRGSEPSGSSGNSGQASSNRSSQSSSGSASSVGRSSSGSSSGRIGSGSSGDSGGSRGSSIGRSSGGWGGGGGVSRGSSGGAASGGGSRGSIGGGGSAGSRTRR